MNELTALTGTNIFNWQDDAAAKSDEEDVAKAQYATLIPQINREEKKKKIFLPNLLYLA